MLIEEQAVSGVDGRPEGTDENLISFLVVFKSWV
jgi:hypothetical protein